MMERSSAELWTECRAVVVMLVVVAVKDCRVVIFSVTTEQR